MRYVATWNHGIVVEIVDDNVTMRTGQGLKRTGVLYRRVDRDEPMCVREKPEFERLFKETKE